MHYGQYLLGMMLPMLILNRSAKSAVQQWRPCDRLQHDSAAEMRRPVQALQHHQLVVHLIETVSACKRFPSSSTRVAETLTVWRSLSHLAQGCRVEQQGAAVREHHAHVLLDAGEPPALDPHQKVAHLHQQNKCSAITVCKTCTETA